MSVGSRVVFTRFVDADSPKLRPWLAHLQRVVSTPHAEIPRGASPMVWQLVSGNNRQLARSPEVYDSFEDATRDAQRIVERSADLEVTPVSEHQRGLFGWYASLDGIPAMVCARWYDTERDRARSIALALPSMGAATLLAGARLVDVTLTGGSTW